ncbi:hypothetical protein RJZ56_007913 [Blastomyces dermatitidis]|uniref:Alpha-1,3-mannosyltransferase n=3 Tax=Blastomyces TaxID=229219 RepID=A0A179UZH6_BLAGS|nr:hypothetical protein, variant [Blastomyces gilchristii SLH14081]XP_031580391.1 uncharacterized protein BDBG_07798 [Blastomyces gilchristii SLH14081]XP_045276873.1 hypothetical protein, variant [Blastomyces dermatitidis ER-3]XP_045281161.1 uncharacterized protein BDCG_05192 [Blastomyces dermatitidis ER-3]EGE83699.1 hypothetical protein BDDG_06644 [Blastomyces dermatitidis ATCC 18188]EEQ90072.1 hypothetical protein, variant [Blastomyces dermatitidis ER-3]KMW68171.1 hypothetical protein, vari
MPPHLHPRSRSTVSLFTLTLMSSLVIVGIPHLFPCPVPRHAYADSEMIMSADGQQKMVRKRRRKPVEAQPAGESDVNSTMINTTPPRTMKPGYSSRRQQEGLLDDDIVKFRQMEEEARNLQNVKRECPVPKPGGMVGELLGFKNQDQGRGRDGIPRADIPGRGNGS